MQKEFFSTKTALFCLVCTLFWGISYPVLKLSYGYWGISGSNISGKLLFAGIRFSAAGLILLLTASVKKKRLALPEKNAAGWVAVLGLVQTALQYSFTYVGLALTTGTKGSVLNQLSVFLVVLLSPVLFHREKLALRKLLGCILGFAGILTMNFKGLSLSVETGDILVIGASCFAAAGYLISKAMPKSCDALTATAWQQFTGGILLLITGICTGGRLSSATLPGIACLLFLILAAAISYSLWFWLLQHNDVGRISISKFLTPLFGVLFSGILLQEKIFTPENGIALLLVCCGVIAVNTRHRT